MTSRAANNIDPDQTEPTMFAKNISKMFQQKTTQTSFIVISVFSALEILFDFVYFQKVMLFSEKCADPYEMRQFIAAFTVCQSAFLGEKVQRVNRIT